MGNFKKVHVYDAIDFLKIKEIRTFGNLGKGPFTIHYVFKRGARVG